MVEYRPRAGEDGGCSAMEGVDVGSDMHCSLPVEFRLFKLQIFDIGLNWISSLDSAAKAHYLIHIDHRLPFPEPVSPPAHTDSHSHSSPNP